MNLDLMNTEERRKLLNAYLDGELSTDEALEVSTWLDANPGALREVEHLRHIWDLLEHYEDEPVSEAFAPGVLTAVGIEHAARGGGKVLQMAWYRRPLATAAAVLVAVGATVFVMSNGEGGAVVPTTDRPATDVVALLENVPADQLQDVLLNADVLLSVDEAALDEEYDEESMIGG